MKKQMVRLDVFESTHENGRKISVPQIYTVTMIHHNGSESVTFYTTKEGAGRMQNVWDSDEMKKQAGIKTIYVSHSLLHN